MNQKITEKALEIINKRKISAENEALQNKIKAFENKEFKNLYQNYVNQMLEDTKNGIVKDYDQEKKTNATTFKQNGNFINRAKIFL